MDQDPAPDLLPDPPDYFYKSTCGCLLGLVVGPVVVTAVILLLPLLISPSEKDEFSVFGAIFAIILSAMFTGLLGAVINPLLAAAKYRKSRNPNIRS